jgi:hypothetical protein
VVEDDIEGPLVLVNGPIVGEGVFVKDLGMNGIELASDAVEQLGPLSSELTIRSGPLLVQASLCLEFLSG